VDAGAEARVAKDHPLRPIRTIVDDASSELWGEFEGLYLDLDRPSIPPERGCCRRCSSRRVLVGALGALLIEQLDCNLLFRWFVGLGIDDPVWHPTAFTTNRDRLLEGEVAARFLAAVLDHPQGRGLGVAQELRPKDDDEAPAGGRNGSRDFYGGQRTNDSHGSTTDPDARLPQEPRQGGEALLHGHVLVENRTIWSSRPS
jgi:Transposase domain (DUF772)